MTSKTHRPFVDFYGRLGVIPTNQDISDLRVHFERRGALYRLLGIPPSLIEGRSVLEFGPGSGHNAVFTASLRPSDYTLVDANPTSLASTRKLLRRHRGGVPIHIVDSDILEFRGDRRFDVVLCEGVIPTQLDPVSFLRHVAAFARASGIVVITCMDSASVLSEFLRRYQAFFVAGPDLPMADRIARLTRFFAPHLDTLSSMSRRREDWVLDTILHPWSGPLFSIDEALTALEGHFVVLGSSPDILKDWRWYKQIVHAQALSTAPARESYWQNVHSFLDHREVLPPRGPAANKRLLAITHRIYRSTLDLELGKKNYTPAQLTRDVNTVLARLGAPSSRAALALRDFNRGLAGFARTGRWSAMPRFSAMWGRGQQYLSMSRV